MTRHILIIEKENSLRAKLGKHLSQAGFRVTQIDQAEAAMALLADRGVDLAVLGLAEFKRDGLSMLRMIREIAPRIPVITLNSGDQLDLSIECMHLGAYDDFLIPFDLEGLIESIHNALT
jgi:two-component system response regulator GlrR